MSDVLEKLLDGYRSIICLNGECPGHFLKKTSLPIIAADGAAKIPYTSAIMTRSGEKKQGTTPPCSSFLFWKALRPD